MANPNQLKLLRRGVETWNKKRFKDRQDIESMEWIDLRGAELTGINLDSVDFVGANLSNANLDGADLSRADLWGANLINASLRSAKLSYTNLTLAYLKGANLESAIFDHTTMLETNLSEVKGLESCRHSSRSYIDHTTLAISGRLPLAFLRGCGLPDTLIEYLPSLLNDPIQFYSCFISYSSKDQDFAERLYADLQSKGVRCWFAPEDLKIGDRIRDRIDESIRLRDKLLLILSENSIASDWVEHEVESALEEERQSKRAILFPVRLDDAVFDCDKAWAALIRRTRHIGDFTEWKNHDSYQKAFNRLLRDLKAEIPHSDPLP